MLLALINLPFSQTFETQDLFVIGLLVLLEGVLSIDNALVLGLLAKNLPKRLQKRALTYGLVGAFVFRMIAIGMASLLLKWWVVKLLGGAYLLYVAIKHVLSPGEAHALEGVEEASAHPDARNASLRDRQMRRKFWSAVLAIELTDIAFAVDSILAAIALVASSTPADKTAVHPKLWVVFTGGFLGVILMRFAAVIFIKLLDRFPRFELAAYLLVLVIGLKLLVDWYFNKQPANAPADWHAPVDFHHLFTPAGSLNWAMVSFWVLMLLCFMSGFLPKAKKQAISASV